MGRVTALLLAVIGLVAGLIWQAPLSFALRQSDIASSGVSWTQARGTVWNGQVTNIAVQQQKVGAVDLSLRPASLLGGSLTYAAEWRGPAGQGNGLISASTNRYAADEVSIAVSLSEIPNLADELKQAGATFRMSRGQIVWHRYDGCVSAQGVLQTDVVRLVGHSLQENWPDLNGSLSCDGASLIADLSGTSSKGENFQIVFSMAASQPLRYRAAIEGVSPDVENALALYGFKLENGAYTLNGNSLGRSTH